MMPAFSAAISATVSPRNFMWSSPTGVTTATSASIWFVASHRPPSPTSTTATSTGASANAAYASAVITSKKESWISERSSTSAMYGSISRYTSTKRSAEIGAPSITTRSVTLTRCGLVYRPLRRPKPSSRASIMRAVDVLPFVPVR